MKKPQPGISVQLVREWRIRRPVVYRYLDKQFVDEFFDRGALRISSFSTFAQHEDEERLDGAEGKGIVGHRNHEGEGQTIIAQMSQGHNAFVLCGSMNYSPELSDAFKTNSGFRIDDSLGFGDAISKFIPGSRSGLKGAASTHRRRSLIAIWERSTLKR
ncbi:MAG TPA: hypothetical protein VFH27_06360 [Longimicrobiaceae bacterium]|nr:hypothetical protein [Longimicrobiaceae bacterium]